MKPDKKEISIIDATLREGQQAPLVSFSIKQSVAIAKGLKLAGVNAIECSHAAISQYEVKKIQAVSAAVPDVEILTHARAHKKDILAAVESGADWVGMFVGINRVSQKHRLRRSYKDILCMIEDNVLLAKKKQFEGKMYY